MASLRREVDPDDLAGVWHVFSEPLEEKKRLFGPDIGVLSVPGSGPETVSNYAWNILMDFKPGEIVMTPEAQAIVVRRRKGDEVNPQEHCMPMGTPLATLVSEVQKIVQTPGLILIMHEIDGIPRQIYTDGRKLPADPNPTWLGSSVGRWSGDTLIVDGYRAKDGSNMVDARRVTLPDGRIVSGASAGDGGPGDPAQSR
jgi:hypothetical protein